MKYVVKLAVMIGIVITSVAATAAVVTPSVELTIANHRFEPASITIPADTKVKLVIHNTDATPEEFESHTLKREKIIPGNSKAVIPVGPLKPGIYPFVGEFNEDTAKGEIVVK